MVDNERKEEEQKWMRKKETYKRSHQYRMIKKKINTKEKKMNEQNKWEKTGDLIGNGIGLDRR
jgi:hypothetical protein